MVNLGTGANAANITLAQATVVPVVVNAGVGNTNFTVNAAAAGAANLTLVGNAGNDTFNVQAASGAAVTAVLQGGAGNDTANITLGNPGATSITTSGVETVNFTGTTTAPTAWTLDHNQLSSGAQAVLVANNAKLTNIQLSGQPGPVQVLSIDHPTILNAGNASQVTVAGPRGVGQVGETLTDIASPLQLSGTGRLLLDDTANPTATPRSLSINAALVSGFDAAGSIAYQGFASLEADLSSATDSVTVLNTSIATTIKTGGGGDSVSVQNLAAATSIDLGGGSDQLTVSGSAASLTVTGASNSATVTWTGRLRSSTRAALSPTTRTPATCSFPAWDWATSRCRPRTWFSSTSILARATMR